MFSFFFNSVNELRIIFPLSFSPLDLKKEKNFVNDVETGKFGAKELAAKEWCIIHNYTYHVVFPKNLQKMKDSILHKSL